MGRESPILEKTLRGWREIDDFGPSLGARIAVKKQGHFCGKGGVCTATHNKIAQR